MALVKRLIWISPLVLTLTVLLPAPHADAQYLTRQQKYELKQKLREQDLIMAKRRSELVGAHRVEVKKKIHEASLAYKQSIQGTTDRAHRRQLLVNYRAKVKAIQVASAEAEKKIIADLNEDRLYNYEQIKKSYGL